VNRTALLVFGLALIGAQYAVAQHGGGHHHSGGGSLSGPTADTKNDDLKGFERAVALQATPDQVAQFQRLSAGTQLARERTQHLLQLSAAGNKPNWINSTYPLTNDLLETQADNEKFLQSFSKEQESGLKKFTKKMRKIDSEITTHSKTLSQQLERATQDDQQIVAVLQKLDKSLADFQSEHLAIAAEMGIQGPTTKSQ
jgi:hypothetical protein